MQIGLWRVDGDPVRVMPTRMPLEERLEAIIESDPAMLGQDLMIIGRQVVTSFGSRIDLMAMDAAGGVHVLKLKRDRTPRDVVAQVLDYGAWVQGLADDDLRNLYASYRRDEETADFDEAFAEAFGFNPPDVLNNSHTLTVVASEMDDATERMVTYLAAGFGVPINVLFFDYYEDDGRSYLARTWMLDQNTTAAAGRGVGGARKKPTWNGQDWVLAIDGRDVPFRTLRLKGPYRHDILDPEQGEDYREWVLPVRWLSTVDREDALLRPGLFANQNSACKLRWQPTIDAVIEFLGVG